MVVILWFYNLLYLKESFKNTPTWKNNNFSVEKPGKYYLNQVVTNDITSDVTWISNTPWYNVQEGHFTSVVPFLKIHNPSLIMRKT